jgi:hypothetical protein
MKKPTVSGGLIEILTFSSWVQLRVSPSRSMPVGMVMMVMAAGRHEIRG